MTIIREKLVVLLPLLVPPFLKLIIRRSRHKSPKQEEERNAESIKCRETKRSFVLFLLCLEEEEEEDEEDGGGEANFGKRNKTSLSVLTIKKFGGVKEQAMCGLY